MSSWKGISLFVATREQTIESRKKTHVQWGKTWSLERYLARDARLDELEQARNGKLKTWVLSPVSDPETLDFFCSCETYQREGLYVPPKTKQPQLCTNFGIASVFTPAHNRGKGYASHMMRLLHWVFAPECSLDRATFPPEWGSPPTPLPRSTSVTFSVLYSDIGEAFYRNCGPTPGAVGWQVVSPIDTVFDIKNLQSRLESSDLPDSEWQWLFEPKAVQIWEGDSKEMIRDLSQETTTAHRLCIFPRGGTAGYLNRRVTEVAPSNSNQSQITWGVRCSDHGQALSFATWCPDPMTPTSATITITRLRANAETFPIILRALCQYAGDQDPVYERLEIWNLPKQFQSLASNLGGTTVQRAEHLDALRVYGVDGDNIEWQFNERYCWC